MFFSVFRIGPYKFILRFHTRCNFRRQKKPFVLTISGPILSVGVKVYLYIVFCVLSRVRQFRLKLENAVKSYCANITAAETRKNGRSRARPPRTDLTRFQVHLIELLFRERAHCSTSNVVNGNRFRDAITGHCGARANGRY